MSADEEAREPLRLYDDPDEPPSLRDALVREKAFRADYDEAKGLARLAATLAAVDPTTGAEDGPSSGRGKWLKVPVAVGLAVLVAGAGVGLSRGGDDRAGPTTAIPSIAPTAATAERTASPESSILPTVSVESLPTAPSLPAPAVARSSRTAHVPAAPPSSAPPVVDPLEETRHLGALRRVAASDPDKALSMIAEGNRRFASGSFREEREAIAVDALARVGRDAEARRAAETFLTTYPTSPLAPSVRRAAGL